jgi:hypothetical protein
MSDKQKLKENSTNIENNDMLDGEEGEGKVVHEPSCWDKTKEGFISVVKVIYFSLAFVFKGITQCLGCVFYPIKEQCQHCYKKIDLCFNPYKDATIHEI